MAREKYRGHTVREVAADIDDVDVKTVQGIMRDRKLDRDGIDLN